MGMCDCYDVCKTLMTTLCNTGSLYTLHTSIHSDTTIVRENNHYPRYLNRDFVYIGTIMSGMQSSINKDYGTMR